jgi:predicted porin
MAAYRAPTPERSVRQETPTSKRRLFNREEWNMIGGLKLTGRLAAAAILCAVGGVPGMEERAEAADLGGDCCADLEERVAELEATTVRKGNKKVAVELYGRVNRVVNFWDDGSESNMYVLNNSYSSTRFGLRGKAKIADGWTSGFQIEIEDEGNLSKFVDQFNDNPTNGELNLRRSAIYFDSKKYGKVWLGQQSTAKDDIVKDTVVIKGLDQTMYSDFYMNWSFFLRPEGAKGAEGMSNIRFRDIGRCYSTSSSAFDCSTRRQEIRYDTPEMWGFVASYAYGEDDIQSVALRFQKEWSNFKVGAGYAYEKFTDEAFNGGGGGVPFQSFKRDMDEWAGMASIIHKPTGLFLWGANSNSQDNDIGAEGFITKKGPPVMHAYDIAGGIHRKFFEPGATTIWGGWTTDQDGLGGFTRTTVSASAAGTENSYSVWNGRVAANRIPGIGFDTEITGSQTDKWYVAVDQAIDSAAMNLYMAYQHITPEISLVTNNLAFSPNGKIKSVPIELEDFDVFFMGGRIQF